MNDPFVIKEDNKKIKDKKLDNTYSKFYVGESELSVNARDGIRRMFDSKKVNYLLWFFFFIIILFVSRLTYLQILNGDYYLSLAEGNRVRIKPIKAVRGIIYDSKNNILVRNEPSFLLQIVPADFYASDQENILDKSAEFLGISKDEIVKKLESQSKYSYQPILIEDNIPYQQALDLKVTSNLWAGVEVDVSAKRKYEYDRYISHVLGYTGKITENDMDLVTSGQYLLNDYLGKSGIEQFYEKQLKGIDGKKQIEVNALGKEQNVISEIQPVKGESLVLNIDIELQKVFFDAIEGQLKKIRATKGAGIILNPNNGAVLAMVSIPSFNNNYFNNKSASAELLEIFQNQDQPLFFRALQGEYPSGSIFKPMVAVAALSEKIIDANTSFLSSGGLRISQWFFPDWKSGGHGVTNVTKALAESVNTFFYYIGGGYLDFTGIGIAKIVEFGKKFGLTKKTQIDFPVEGEGFLPSKQWKQDYKKEKWYIGDTYNASIGQGDILVTPLQMAVMYSAIVNGGDIYAPQFLKAKISGNSENIKYNNPKLLEENIIDDEYLEIVKKGLGQAVTIGSAKYLSLLPVSSGGKTGTAQVGGDKMPHAWFAGFAPYDKPEIVIIVLIENGEEGSRYAVPVAYDVFKWYFADRNKNVE